MREYFLYTLLVFLPIAAVMFYILKSYRLSFSAIWSILVLSFIIIITFPVSITKIGTIFTIVVYCIVLGGLSIYLMQYDDGCSLENNSEGKAESWGFGLDKVQNGLPGEEALPVNILSPTLATDGEEIAAVMEITDKEAKKDICGVVENGGLKKEPREKAEDMDGKQVLIPPEELAFDDKEEEFFEVTAEVTGDEAEKEETEDAAVDEGEEAACQEASWTEVADGEESRLVVEGEEKASEMIAQAAATDEDKGANREGNDRSIAGEKELRIIELLDSGFAAKTVSDFNNAFACFYEAWQDTDDSELKYMLALELAEMSTILGWYSQGEEILVKCINEALLNEAMRKELEKKRVWLEIIQKEMRKLKLEEVPYSRLPRLVKVKAEEEWRRLYT